MTGFAITQNLSHFAIICRLYLNIFHFCTATMAQEKVKILCLHGYRQNARIMNEKTGGIRSALKIAELHFMDAPHRVAHSTDDEKNPRGWWFSTPEHTFAGEKCDIDIGFQESLDAIEEKYKKDGPYDGLLGFSQGACLAGIVASIDQQKNVQRFKFIITIAGFKSHVTSHSKFYENVIQLPSLHVMGETDDWVPKKESEILAKCFDPEGCESFVHGKGHLMPCDKNATSTLSNFIKKFSKVSSL